MRRAAPIFKQRQISIRLSCWIIEPAAATYHHPNLVSLDCFYPLREMIACGLHAIVSLPGC